MNTPDDYYTHTNKPGHPDYDDGEDYGILKRPVLFNGKRYYMIESLNKAMKEAKSNERD
jgi:hypothetical protein